MVINYRKTPFSMEAVYLPPVPVQQAMNDTYLAGTGQGIINRMFGGATPEDPLRIPIQLPEISLSKETLDDMGKIMLESVLVLGAAIIVGKVIEGTLRQ